MAALLERAFAGRQRAWSAAELRDLLATGCQTFLAIQPRSTVLTGLAICRTVLDEMEILTIAADPPGKGVGQLLIRAIELEARRTGVRRIHLEVAASNVFAQKLYLGVGFVKTGVRKKYFTTSNGISEDAHLFLLTIN